MYAIIDIETTGGSSRIEKITEIAIYLHDGNKVTGEFVSLVNPERNIPYFITNLTGITNEMVEDAPRFYEIAKTVVELTEGRTFVAHNANLTTPSSERSLNLLASILKEYSRQSP
jgi:DNA polymerase-3 subunit epsilon